MRLTAVLHALLLPVLFLAGRCIADDNVDRHVERLGSSRFEDREEATRALIGAGERGVAAARGETGNYTDLLIYFSPFASSS